jgi:hypothetical protein
MLGDHDEVVTRTLTQRRSELGLSEIAVGHAEALHSTVVLQHKEFVNLHPDSPRGRREGDIAHVRTSLSSPATALVPYRPSREVPLPADFERLRGRDSNPNFLVQSQASCR